MELKPGYKQTEVGVIPEDWEVSRLGNFIALQRGHDLTWRERRPGTVPIMGSAGQNGFHDTALAKAPGIVLGRSGASFGQAHFCGSDFWPHNTALYVTDFRNNDPLFVFYFLKAIDFTRHNSGGAQQSLNRNFIAPIAIAVPPLPEQRAIATALNEVDGLIRAQEQLIAKKRDLKQAAMQQLLTAQHRLPGFSGEWVTKRLGDIAAALKGSGLSKDQLSDSGTEKCILYGELFTRYERRISKIHNRTNIKEGIRSRHGDLLIPGSTTTKGVDLATVSALLEPDVLLGGDINIIRAKGQYFDPAFMAYYLTDRKKQAIAERAQGITIVHLYGRDILDIVTHLPPLSEQTAIAEVLSDMDEEQAALETRLAKTRALKQGMMQSLLTGRIRLV